MRLRNTTIYLLAALCIVFCLPVKPASAAGEGAAIRLSCTQAARVGERILVRVELTASETLAGAELGLHYDAARVKPVITDNSEGAMDAFVVSAPAGWEQMCSLDTSGGLYRLRFVCDEAEKNLLQKGKTLVAEVPFTVAAAGVLHFSAPSGEVIAVGADKSATLYGSGGDELDITAAGDSEKLSVQLSCAETVAEGSELRVDIVVSDIGDDSGIIGCQFELVYDRAAVVPVITDNASSQMDAFIVSAPGNGWEQMCTHDPAGGRYILRFAAKHAGTNSGELLKRGDTLSVSIPFRVIGAKGANAAFSAGSASVVGVSMASPAVSGVGSSCRTQIVAEPSKPIPGGEYDIVDGVVIGVHEKTSVADFLKKSAGARVCDKNGRELTRGYVGTGCTVYYANGSACTVLVKGDTDGSGTADATDYLIAKRTYLGTYVISGLYYRAACIMGGDTLSMVDLLMLKRHVLGTADIYTVAK